MLEISLTDFLCDFFADEDWNFIERVYLIGHRNFSQDFFSIQQKSFLIVK